MAHDQDEEVLEISALRERASLSATWQSEEAVANHNTEDVHASVCAAWDSEGLVVD